MPALLRREERLERVRERLGVHSVAGVRDLEKDVVARLHRDVAERAGTERHVHGAHGQPAALGHRVAGVDGEVDEDLLDLPRVGLHAPEVRDRGSKRILTSSRRTRWSIPSSFFDDVVQLEDVRLQDLLAAEREQLARQRGRALGRLAHLLDVLPDVRGRVAA